jgi:hypothetical protein
MFLDRLIDRGVQVPAGIFAPGVQLL